MAARKPEDGGIANPKEGLTMLSVAPVLYVGCSALANYISKPGGVFEKLLNGILSTSAYVATAGTQSSIPAGRVIPALSALYIFSTYSLGSASSASAIAGGFKEGRNNKYPRAQALQLTGLPLRAHSAHQHLMEVFPAFALAAALTATLAPTNQHLINLLGVHVVAKLFVFWPAYLANLDGLRGIGHLVSTGALVSTAYKLALG